MPFLTRHLKTPLVFVIESVLEIHCSIEGLYSCIVGYRNEVVIQNHDEHYYCTQSESIQIYKHIFTPELI